MTVIYVICAALGGTILLCQALMTLIGLGGDSLHIDTPGDLGHDLGADLHGADWHDGGGLHDAGGHVGHHGGGALHDSHGQAGHGTAGSAASHGTTWLFGVISFRTLVAAATFFGLVGLTMHSAGATPVSTFLAAAGAGVAAMYGVYSLMKLLYGLRADGTVRVHRAVGAEGSVYVPIPGHRDGAGKIQLNLQNRTMEYSAVTAGNPLPTGARIVVVDLVDSDCVEVRAISEPERN